MEVLEVRKTDSETLFKNYINSQSYQKDFKEFMYKMVDKYGIDILNLNGIGEQLDINKAIKKMMSSTTMADTSVDSNSNTNIVTSGAVFTETCKAHSLIHNHYRVWKFMKKNHGLEYANDLMERKISGQIYINDLSGFYPYCFNFDPIHFALYGIPKKLDGKGESLPPQHMESFFGILEDILPIFAKNLAGACGIATLFPVLSIYVQKALLEGNKIDEIQLKDEQAVWDFLKVKLTSLLYNLNRPARDGSQSLFTNVSIMSPTFLQETCKDMTLVFKNGMIITADVDTTLRIQDIWIDVFNKESERRLFTFPVQTLSIATIEDENGRPKIVDTDFYNEMMKKNIKLGAMNVYAGDSSTLSSCCFGGEQKVLTKSSTGIKLCSFKEIADGAYNDYRNNFTVFHNGSWCKAKLVVLDEKRQMFKVTTHNNKVLYMTDNHLNLTKDGLKETKDLIAGKDYLAFNTRPLDTYAEVDRGLTYEQGVLIGAYLGDGSKYKRLDCESYEVTFSLSAPKLHLLTAFSKALEDWGIKANIHMYDSKNNVKFVKCFNKDLYDIICEYTEGKDALTKGISPVVYGQSILFRRGILDGLYATDGGNSCRIYSSSEKLIQDVETLCTTLGLNTVVSEDPRENITIRGIDYERNAPVKCIKWYNLRNKRGMGDGVKVVNNTEYFQIKSVEPYNYTDDKVYCFQMLNEDEPFFTLPNGVITHNCRLRSDKAKVFTNSLGGSSSNIGSFGVCTVNLATLALRYKGDIDKFYTELDKNIEYAQEINRCKMNFIKRDIKNGNLPMYDLRFVELDKQYATLGINGLYECCQELGYDYRLKENRNFVKSLLQHINTLNDKLGEKMNHIVNVEQIPAENVAVKLANIDKKLGLNSKYDIYANQFIPLDITTEGGILDRISIQGELDEYFSGGSILHINLDQECKDEDLFLELGKYAIENGVRYFGINYATNHCNNCGGTFVGKLEECPHCQSKNFETWCRTVGYMVPVENYNKVRRQEFERRVFYKEHSIKVTE